MRVGFVIGGQLREIRFLRADRPTGGGLGVMRFGWIAEHVNAVPGAPLHYELYRPWRRYHVLLFMKAMDAKSRRLLDRHQRKKGKAIFDANENDYERSGTYYFTGMEPTEEQTRQAVHMTRTCEAVIADSLHLAEVCRRYAREVTWIPDNVNMGRVPAHRSWDTAARPLPLLWSGQAHKLFELLRMESTLRSLRKHIKLVLVTNALEELERCTGDLPGRVRKLLADVPHELIPFRSLEQLFGVYARGGVALAPRFLDNPYNLAHTEWKITLPMACGRVVLCSPLPSYVEVGRRAGHAGLRVCRDDEEWGAAFEALLSGAFDYGSEEEAARRVVETDYSTAVIAPKHAAFVERVAGLRGGGA